MNLEHVISELVEERGLDRDVISKIIAEGVLSAYTKKYPDLELDAKYNSKENRVDITILKKVVPSSTTEMDEVSLRKARVINKKAKEGDLLRLPFDGEIGRIEILKAKQIIASSILNIESEKVYSEFKSKEGSMIHGTIHKAERNGVSVKIQDTFAFLPRSLTVPGERFVVGHPIRALLKEVLEVPRNENQLILDRSSDEFLRALLELEIPEIFERVVEIKKIVRAPGYKSKIVVVSNSKNIDPVGTCVGVGGARIKPILRELGMEKIDIIAETDSIEQFVKDSLKPAVIDRVVVDNDVASVWLAEDQRSLAIGKMGKNIMLASKLVGLEINLIQEESSEKETLADVLGEIE